MLPYAIPWTQQESNSDRTTHSMGSLWFWKLFQIFAYEHRKNLALQPHLKHSGPFRKISWVPGIRWYVTFFRLFRPEPFGMYQLDMKVSGFTPTTQHCQSPREEEEEYTNSRCRPGVAPAPMAKQAEWDPEATRSKPQGSCPGRRNSRGDNTSAAQFPLWTIKTRLEGTWRQPAHPLPYCRISCPFNLKSLCKIISAKQRIRPSVCLENAWLSLNAIELAVWQ